MPRGTNPDRDHFLDMLFPWEPEHQSLFKSVTWSFVAKDGTSGMANYAAQSFDDLTRLIETRGSWANTNTYVALGTQRTARVEKITKDGFMAAVRKISNVVSFKSIYLDLDVKPDAYATTEDAFAALDDFIAAIGLPPASMEVLSGTGGVHVYWCLDRPIPIAAWSPLATALRDAALAYGLKFDPQVTVNAAGILRVPGTWNFKRTPPTQVTLLQDSSFATYGYQELVTALGSYVGPMTGVRLHAVTGAAPARQGSYTQNFTDGVTNAPPVSIDDVAVNCGVISDILDRGGKGDAEPLWSMALYLASFTDDPRAAAHALSDQDPRYSPADTDKKLDEKINARTANPAAGWPSCASFSPLHSACVTCPLFSQGKSPLNFAVRPQVQVAVQQQFAAAQANADPLMPHGYYRNLAKHVETTIEDKEKVAHIVDVLGYPVLDAGIDKSSGDLVLRTVVGGVERWGGMSVQSNMQPVAAAQAMAKGTSIYIKSQNYKIARDFLVAWMTKLQEAKKEIKPTSLGWTDDGKGFTFDDKTYFANGPELAFRGTTIDGRFGSKGDIACWQNAMKLVYGNAPLEVVVASAFAAPLVSLIGSTSVVLSVFSHLSGVGKTTSMQLAQAVWGNYRTGMSSLDDTQNSVLKKVADLKSLPVYWDELRTMEQLKTIVNLVFSITQGKAKSRLNRDITQAEAGSFTTMFVIASNYGLADTIYSNTDATEAGGLRIFEVEATDLPKGITDYQSRQMMLPLEHNYGVAGARFGSYLASNRPNAQRVLDQVNKALMAEFNFSSKERFWSMTMSTILAGAILANDCGITQFNLPVIKDFMRQSLLEQRATLKTESHQTLSTDEDVLSLLNEMMSDLRGKNMIMTDYISYNTQGRPMPVKLLDADPSRLGDVWMQVGDVDKKIRVRVRPFNEWLRKHKQHPGNIKKKLEKYYHVHQSRQTIGSGVAWLDSSARAGRSMCYDFTPLVPLTSPGSNPD